MNKKSTALNYKMKGNKIVELLSLIFFIYWMQFKINELREEREKDAKFYFAS